MGSTKMNYEERLMYVTRNLAEYNLYDGDLDKAALVVKKYFRTKSLKACRQSLEYFVKAYDDGGAFVERNKRDYWEKEKPARLYKKEQKFFADHKKMSPGILLPMLYWIFNWNYER